jgi:hypothetical protein
MIIAFYIYAVIRIKPRALLMLGKNFTTELNLQTSGFGFQTIFTHIHHFKPFSHIFELTKINWQKHYYYYYYYYYYQSLKVLLCCSRLA